MLKRLRLIAQTGLLLCGFSAPAAVSATNSYIVWNTEKDELLPQSSVIAMTQTRDGYLWLGTMKGLVRFDGQEAQVYDPLGSATIIYLFEDSRGGLWAGTERNGVALIKGGAMTNVVAAGGPGGKLVSACEDASGAVWLCTADGRLSRFRNGARENEWELEDFQVGGFRAVVTELSGQLLLASAGRLSRVTSDVHASPFSLQLQRTLQAGRQDFLFASKSGGYWQFQNGRVLKCITNQVVRDLGEYSWDQTSNPVTAACEDADGNLFVGTYGDGVFRYDRNGRVTRISSPGTLTHNTVLSLWVDREGSLWVGTNGGGLNRVKHSFFTLHPDTAGKTVQSASEDNQGGLWIGLNGDAVNTDAVNHWKDGLLEQFGPAQGLLNPVVRSVFVDSRQTVWVGGINEGGLFQLANGRFRIVPGTASLLVSVLFEDRATNLWVGADNGLARWDGQAWRLFTMRDGLTVNAVRALAGDAQGNLWIGTDGGGLNSLRDGKFASIRQSQGGLPGDSVTALLCDTEDVLWVGTSGGGLGRFYHGEWTHYTKREGLAGNSITYLIEDGLGALWIGSNEGLMRIEKSALNIFAGARSESRGKTIHVRTFGKPDGLPTRECTSGSQPAACRTRDGRLWFPTTKGLVGVNPTMLARNTNPPPVLIESVLVDNEPQGVNPFQVRWSKDVVLPASRERLEIHFTSLNLSSPEQARFRYRLAGHENWAETQDMHEVHYGKLPHGRYRFEVTACNEDGVWNPTPATVGIVVEPPFWKTWWFQALVVIAILGATIGTVYFISTQRLERQLTDLRQREALERERARIARDLHDQLGANLTQVALLGELAGEDKRLPEEVEAHAKQICTTARETSLALDEIVWSANPQNDTLEGLVNYACKYAQDYLRVAGLRYRLDVPAQLPATILPPDLRHNVFLAFKESVNNVVKHAKASEVAIRLRLDGDMFTMEIEDDGCGPAGAQSKTGRNGMRNMSRRMDDVGGTFAFEPAPGKGTRVRLTAPIGKKTK